MRLVKVLSRGEGIRTLLWTFIKSFQVCSIEISNEFFNAIRLGTTLCRSVDCNAILYLCSHWHAGKRREWYRWISIGEF